MDAQLSYKLGNSEVRRRDQVQVVFHANPDRKGGFIINDSDKPLQVRLGESGVVELMPNKAIQFGAELGDVRVGGEYMQRFRAMEFY